MGERIPATKITLTRAEGPTEDCITVTVGSFAEATETLRRWSRTAPAVDKGGYDKCDFRVEWADGEVYEGRYDLKRNLAEEGPLHEHILTFLRFHAGLYCPAHLTPTRYADVLAQYEEVSPGIQADSAAYIEKYAIEG